MDPTTPPSTRGFFAIGVCNSKKEINVGTLLRSAQCFGADFIFTVGRRYTRQASDTMLAWRHTPLFSFTDMNDLVRHLPYSCPLVGVEMAENARSLTTFIHPERACYLLGAEDHGLSSEQMAHCHHVVMIPGGTRCLNVASAGSIVLYDRVSKAIGRERGLRVTPKASVAV